MSSLCFAGNVYFSLMLILGMGVPASQAQQTGTLRGTVKLESRDSALPHAMVLIAKLGRNTLTGADGSYEFTGVPAGEYEVMAHLHPLADERKTVVIPAGGVAVLDFSLRIAPLHEEITVTATGREEAALDVIQSASSVELAQLLPKASTSLGELLQDQPGVSKRSYGPGTGRPVIRGFDGDRVLILQDGMPSGTLSSQSGDHGEPVDSSTINRVEIVRGPATLLYGTNALGGVVNVITDHHQEHEHAHQGVRGYLTGTAGSANAQGGGGGGFEFGSGPWLLTSSGGGARTGDYSTPAGKVLNSGTDIKNAAVTLARYGDRGYLRGGYGEYRGLYGIPAVDLHEHNLGGAAGALQAEGGGHDEHEGPVRLRWRRQNAQVAGGAYNLGPSFERIAFRLNYSDWSHKELVGEEIGTQFFNRQFSYRAVLDQRQAGRLGGRLGVQGLRRSYRVRGDEQVTPPVTQDGFAAFALEQYTLDRVRFQFGGRIETNRYQPEALLSRTFTGFSGSAGLNARLWKDGAFIAAYTHSYRAPSIEELYNFGPHHGNLAFEVGDPNLRRERAEGFETGLRHFSGKIHAQANFFYYRISNYVYLEPTGEVEDGLRVAKYLQGDSRYLGGEASLHVGMHRNLWLNLSLDAVDAELKSPKIPLPRIPPLRGRAGVEGRYGNFSFQPELILARPQKQVYFNETPTAGYALANLTASYTAAGRRALQILSVNVFNAGNRLYRNHVSLIKDFAPEIGRGIRVSYTIRFL